MDASGCAFMCLQALQDYKCCLCESECTGTSRYSSPGSSGILRFQSFCLNRFVVRLHLFTLPLFLIVFGNGTHLHISIFVGTVIDTMGYPAPSYNIPIPLVLAKLLRVVLAFINYCSFAKKAVMRVKTRCASCGCSFYT